MSIKWMAEIWENGPDDPIDRYVLVKLADNAGDDGRCFPSLAEICRQTRLSESTIRRSIQHLEKEGRLNVQRGRGAGNRSQYHLQKVSDGNLSQGNLSQGKVSEGPTKGVTGTEKGVTQTEPPHPHKGVTVKNHHEPSKGSASEVFVLPDWIPLPLWNDYEDMRRLMKKAMTPKARKLAIDKLSELKALGNDPGAVLEQSIFNSWQGLFPVKPNSDWQGVKHASGNGNRNSQRSDGNLSAFESFAREAGVDLGAIDGTGRSTAGVDHGRDNEGLFRAAV